MGKRKKLIESIRNNPKDVPFEAIKNVLLYYGCTIRSKKHYVFSHEMLDYSITIKKNSPIKAYAAKQALKMIDDIVELSCQD